MTRHSIGNGVYAETEGDVVVAYWARPWIARRRTWRKLDAKTESRAIREAALADYEPKGGNFEDLAEEYLKADCPNRRLESRPSEFVEVERARLIHVKNFFGRYQPEEIKMPLCLKYRAWRHSKLTKKVSGERTVDLDLNTLSNVLNYGVSLGRIEFNFIRSGRPRFRRKADVQGSRTKAPADADQIHKLAAELFSDARSQSCGWMMLFAATTGCRTSELLRLRSDARDREHPGFVEGNHLFIRRSKRGVNPFILITPEMVILLERWRAWKREAYPHSHWFFPGRRIKGRPSHHLEESGLGHSLTKACVALGMAHVSPHGLRSFYVTKRRSDGASDPQIAAEIGDKTVSLIRDTYGDLPANWTGGKALAWLPESIRPAWETLKKKAKVDSQVDSLGVLNGKAKVNKTPVLIGAPTRS